MNVDGRHYRTIWLKEDDSRIVRIINQQLLPFKFEIIDLRTVEDAARAIKDMYVRGAGLIGATAAFGIYLASLAAAENSFDEEMAAAASLLKKTRPTASNLAWAADRMLKVLSAPGGTLSQKREAARSEAQAVADEDAGFCERIGIHGLEIIKKISERKNGETVNILTHCNAGWLAFVDYGSALSPCYAAFDRGIKVHVWVDETRPRCQGAFLTAWELGKHGVPHDLVADNAGGHLMQHGLVDLVITGADRVTRRGDAANKIGTYLKAVAAKENGVPFYVALPSSTFDFAMSDGVKEIPIEERSPSEVRFITGKSAAGSLETVEICPETTAARNWGFDVTPARYISGLITERGICEASENAIAEMFPAGRAGEAKAEGNVKYTAVHTAAAATETPLLKEINEIRTRLFDMKLVGILPDGVSFGNVSVRHKNNTFVISGTGTGAERILSADKYCLVNSIDVDANSLKSTGPVKASSESMTHGVIYAAIPEVNAVIHVHSRAIFDGMLKASYPSTPPGAAYGTPEIARAIARAVSARLPETSGAVVLAGHDEGLVVYAASPAAAFKLIEELYYNFGTT